MCAASSASTSSKARAIAGPRIGGDPIGEQLQRDEAVQAAVFRLVDDPHAALAQDAKKTIVRNGAVRHGRGHYSHPGSDFLSAQRDLEVPLFEELRREHPRSVTLPQLVDRLFDRLHVVFARLGETRRLRTAREPELERR